MVRPSLTINQETEIPKTIRRPNSLLVGLALSKNEIVPVKVLDVASPLQDGGKFTGETATIKKVKYFCSDLFVFLILTPTSSSLLLLLKRWERYGALV